MPLRIELLGGFRIYQNSNSVTGWKTEQAKDLFKILLSAPGQYFVRDQLIEYLWPESTYEQGARSLRTRVHELRKVIEHGEKPTDSIIETGKEVYRIRPNADLTLDVQDFDHFIKQAQRHQMSGRLQNAIECYQQAINLYKGNYLPEDRYKDWAFQEEQRWRRIYLTALLDQSDCLARRGKYRAAIDCCLRSIEIDDCQEDVYRQVMFYYHLMENRGKALAIYEVCVQVMDKSLDTTPSDPTQILYQQILDGFVPDVDNIYPPSKAKTISGPTPEKLPFMGRQADYDKLIGLLEQSVSGRGQLAIICGRAGVGKSRLAQEVCAYALQQENVCLLQGESTVIGKSLPYQALIQALDAYIIQQSSCDHLPTHSLNSWSTLLDSIESVEKSALSPQEERIRMFQGFVDVLHAIANQHGSVVVYLDNLHWANASTLALLDYALPQLQELPILILAASRIETLDSDHALNHYLQNVRAADEKLITSLIELDNLSIAEIQKLLAQTAPALDGFQLQTITQSIFTETNGNPLYVRAVLKELFTKSILDLNTDGTWHLDLDAIVKRADQIPADIQSLLLQQLERLDEDQQELLGCMSVFGAHVEEQYLRSIWQKLHSDVEVLHLQWLRLIESLEGAMLIQQKGTLLSFDHDRVQEVTYDRLKDFLRRSYHELAIEILEESVPTTSDIPHALLVYHCLRAGRLQEALIYLKPALENAVKGYRNQEALQLAQDGWDAATQLIDKGQEIEFAKTCQWEILLNKANVFDHLAIWPEWAETLETMTALCNPDSNSESWMKLLELKANYSIRISDFESATHEADSLIDKAHKHNRKDFEARGLRLISHAAMMQGDFPKAFDYVHQEEEFGKKDTIFEQAELEYYIAGLCLRTDQYEKASELMERALAMFTEVNAQQEIARLLIDRGILLRRKGDLETSLKMFEQARTLCSENGAIQIESRAFENIGYTLTSMGDYELACSNLLEALYLVQQLNDKRGIALENQNLGWVHYNLGNLEQAKAFYDEALSLFEELGIQMGITEVTHDLAMIETRYGNNHRALIMMKQALQGHQDNRDRRSEATVFRSIGELYLNECQFKKALEMFETSLALNESLGIKIEMMRMHAFLAWASVETGNAKRALKESEKALNLLDVESPHVSLVYWARYKAVGQESEEGHAVIDQAREAVMRIAGKIKDKDLYRSFLNIPLHQSILTAHKASLSKVMNEKDCYELLRQTRWPEGVVCLKCGGDNLRPHGNVEQSAEHRYWCRDCKKTFSDRTGTVFAYRNLPMDKMFQAIKGISDGSIANSKTLAQAIDIHPNSATKLFKDFSKAIKKDALVKALLPHFV
jgi:DNA-binding SARP family transcriptional activator/transposase-like protein